MTGYVVPPKYEQIMADLIEAEITRYVARRQAEREFWAQTGDTFTLTIVDRDDV